MLLLLYQLRKIELQSNSVPVAAESGHAIDDEEKSTVERTLYLEVAVCEMDLRKNEAHNAALVSMVHALQLAERDSQAAWQCERECRGAIVRRRAGGASVTLPRTRCHSSPEAPNAPRVTTGVLRSRSGTWLKPGAEPRFPPTSRREGRWSLSPSRVRRIRSAPSARTPRKRATMCPRAN